MLVLNLSTTCLKEHTLSALSIKGDRIPSVNINRRSDQKCHFTVKFRRIDVKTQQCSTITEFFELVADFEYDSI